MILKIIQLLLIIQNKPSNYQKITSEIKEDCYVFGKTRMLKIPSESETVTYFKERV